MNKPGTYLLSIGEATAEHGVAVATLRRWHRQGRVPSALRTLGSHRRYASEAVRSASGAQRPAAVKTICYALGRQHQYRGGDRDHPDAPGGRPDLRPLRPAQGLYRPPGAVCPRPDRLAVGQGGATPGLDARTTLLFVLLTAKARVCCGSPQPAT